MVIKLSSVCAIILFLQGYLVNACLVTEFQCKSGKCIKGEYVCDGEKDCKDGSDEDPAICKPGSCGCFGDPHYRTFDGRMVHFQGVCRYVFATDLLTNNFTVEVQNEERGFEGVSWTEKVWASFGDVQIEMKRGGPTLVNGRKAVLPYDQSGVHIHQRSRFTLITTNLGIEMKWNGDNSLKVIAPASYRGKMGGLCGNFNNVQKDDLMLPNGRIATSSAEFGNGWKTKHGQLPRCRPADDIDPCQRNGPRARKTALSKCALLQGPAFQPCHAVVSPEPYVEACVYDLCVCTNDSCLCDVLSSYSQRCHEEGVSVNWRPNTPCEIKCPGGQIFNECASPCPKTCYNYRVKREEMREHCFSQCIPGCQCPEGKLLHEEKCIKPNQCPCNAPL